MGLDVVGLVLDLRSGFRPSTKGVRAVRVTIDRSRLTFFVLGVLLYDLNYGGTLYFGGLRKRFLILTPIKDRHVRSLSPKTSILIWYPFSV